jgi:hypothetical protein
MEPAALRVRLLGGLELRLDGRRLPPLESARAESLLAYLLLHREAPQPRQRLDSLGVAGPGGARMGLGAIGAQGGSWQA